MTRPTLLIVLALLLGSSTEAVGQIWERIAFQDSFSGKFSGKAKKVKPASFSVLLPDDTTASYSIRSAMRVGFGFESLGQKIDIGPFVEYRLLSNIKKPQNVFTVGLSTNWQTREAEGEGGKWSAVLAARVFYKSDFERSTRSVVTDLLFTPVAEDQGGGLANLFLPNVASQFGSAVEFTYSPSIGLEHESVVSAADESRKNSVVRAVSGVRAELLPLPSHLSKRLELTVEYSYVYDLQETADPDQLHRGHQLVTADANVWFLKTDAGTRAGVSLKYTNGESRKRGFRQQKLTELTFSLKF